MANGEKTNKEMLTALYTEMLGIDGQGGMRGDIKEVKDAGVDGRKRIHEKIDEVETHIDQAVGKMADHLRMGIRSKNNLF